MLGCIKKTARFSLVYVGRRDKGADFRWRFLLWFSEYTHKRME
ncbi:hypothetical protein SBV1_3270006 [Verrucomicrobia bacterium]|nr:hypothetical protein SBV1_3270006 [Verrucomicrobiota bacterium]